MTIITKMSDARAASRRGLTAPEAAERLRAEGPNALPELERRTALRIIADVVREPMFALLLGAGVLYLLLGSRGEALVLFAFACFSVAIAIIQEGRSERVLEALLGGKIGRASCRERVESGGGAVG